MRNPWKHLLANVKKSRWCQKHNSPPEITVEDLVDIFYKQKGLCYWLKIKLEPLEVFENCLQAMSVDRIDNTKGYTKDNIVICTRFANLGRNDKTIKEMKILVGPDGRVVILEFSQQTNFIF